jgi:glycolate oxidase
MLLAKIDEVGEGAGALVERMAQLFRDAGGTEVRTAEAPEAVDVLFRARRLAYPALERLGPVLTEDVCVPRMKVPEMLTRIQAAAAEHDVVIANIAHAGDGNLHPLIIATPDDPAAEARAQEAFARIIDDCLALGGTVAGEHGVGLLKLHGAHDELGPRVLEMHESIKGALDPRRLLNPGKAFPKH